MRKAYWRCMKQPKKHHLVGLACDTLRQDGFYANEANYLVKDSSGNVVYHDETIHFEHQRTLYLNPNQLYAFETIDTYGDGWCCEYGRGDVKVYAGPPSQQRNMLMHFNDDFAYSQTTRFYGPAETTQYDDSPKAIFESTVAPQLEEDMGKFLTYFVNEQFDEDTSHSLSNTWPQIVVNFVGKSSPPTPEC